MHAGPSTTTLLNFEGYWVKTPITLLYFNSFQHKYKDYDTAENLKQEKEFPQYEVTLINNKLDKTNVQ